MPKPKRRHQTARDRADEVFGQLVPYYIREEIHARIGELLKARRSA